MKNIALPLVLLVGMSVTGSIQAQGTVYVSNLHQTPTGTLAVGSDSWIGQGFYIQTPDPSTYILNSVQLAMVPASGNPRGFEMSIYSAVGDVGPEQYVGTLAGPGDPVNAGIFTYAASGLTLSSSFDYYVVVTADTPVMEGSYGWSTVPGGTQSGDWAIGNGYGTSSDGLTWMGHPRHGALQLAINATPVPEPATWVLAGLGVLLLVIRRCQPRRSTKF